MKKPIPILLLILAGLLVATVAGPAFGANGGGAVAGGFRALNGEEAASFVPPSDTVLVRSFPLRKYDLIYNRYEQIFGDQDAKVLGAQLTLYTDESGSPKLVIGSYYPNINPTNSIRRSRDDARKDAERDVGPGKQVFIDLLINPTTGRYFHRVETRSLDSRWFHWIDAGDGVVLNKYNGIETDHGTGVKGDTKDINGPDDLSTTDDLTSNTPGSHHGGGDPHWDLFSNDGRQQTYDYRNKDPFIYYVTDADNHWDLVTNNRKSPGQPALIDAQYYAKVTDDYFLEQYDLDWVNDCGYSAMQSIAHYNRNYNNAFWSGTYTFYGDGDGNIFRELSGALDVVAHEHGHGVTECTSGLIYQDESGALNESYSDVLGSGAEFFANEQTPASNCVLVLSDCADWAIGEDIYLPSDTVPGFRNMANPAEDGDPDHYSELYTGSDDNGGVHGNSGIPNHAYYLLVNGGSNAGEALGHGHSGPAVTAISLGDAEDIFYLGFIGLSSGATMADARDATVAAAITLFRDPSQQLDSTMYAWCAVGLGTDCGDVVVSDADPGTSTITASLTSIPADGGTTSTITVQLKDADGIDLPSGGDTVVLSTDLGNLGGTVTDNGNGTYTETLTAGAIAGTATITGILNGQAMSETATVDFEPGPANLATSTITADPTSIPADGTSTSTITVQLKDQYGNNLTTGGDTVTISADIGSLIDIVTDNGDGTYTETLMSSDSVVTATVSGTLGLVAEDIIDTATVDFTVVGGGGIYVSSIDPGDMYKSGPDVGVSIIGSGFDPGVSVSFENGCGPSPSAYDIVVSGDGMTITANVTHNGGGPSNKDCVFDLRVTNPDTSTDVLVDGFIVKP